MSKVMVLADEIGALTEYRLSGATILAARIGGDSALTWRYV